MRIVIDMQGIQNGSRYRGIGRYTRSFAKALIRNKGQNEIIILLSGLFPDSIQSIRSDFNNALSKTSIKVWDAVGPTSYLDLANDWRRKSSQFLREAFIASLEPDVLIVSSMFEGAGDDSVTSIGEFSHIFTVAILYDLIPLIYEKEYLADKRVMAWYSEKIENFKKADIWLAISESSRQEGIGYLGLPEDRVENISAAVGPKFRKIEFDLDQITEIYAKFGIIRPFVMYSGATDPRKNVKRLINAYAAVPVSIRKLHQLVLAGGMPEDHRYSLGRYVSSVGLNPDEVVFTGRVTDDELVVLYNLCKVFILPSFHEGFGLPALEAMACGAATIGSNVSSIPEVIGMQSALFDPWSVKDIARKITQVLLDENFCRTLINHGLEQSKTFSWDKTAQLAIQKIESLDKEGEIKRKKQMFDATNTVSTLVSKMAMLKSSEPSESDLIACASAIAKIIPREDLRPRIFVDVSELHRRDLRTGIQRVVRSIAKNLLDSLMQSHKIELIYATENEPYRHAANFSRTFFEKKIDNNITTDEIIDPRDGDIFLGLDFHDQIVFSHLEYYNYLRQRGVRVYFVVYDLLPIILINFFSDEVKINYEKWLSVVTAQDGVICISRTVVDQLSNWVSTNHMERQPPLEISWFHLGADVGNSVPTLGLPDNASIVLNELSSRLTFISVGTIEPRKRYDQILAAFEMLSELNIQVNLVIIGRRGWMMEQFVNYLSNHSELGKRLFWLECISDEYLERIYSVSTCLIAASEGEGFGLPLIEAAQHKLPIIARDISVFREVAGEHAYYFSGLQPSNLAEAIIAWLDLFKVKKHPPSDTMPWVTWAQCTENLIKILIKSV